jgi:accessory colonization factor AcfC
MLAGKAVHAFQFNSQDAIDKDVDIIFADAMALIHDLQRNFDRRRNSPKHQFLHQRALVDLLKESSPQSIGDLEDGRQDGLR